MRKMSFWEAFCGQDVILRDVLWEAFCGPGSAQGDIVRERSHFWHVILADILWAGCHSGRHSVVRMSFWEAFFGQDVILGSILWARCHSEKYSVGMILWAQTCPERYYARA